MPIKPQKHHLGVHDIIANDLWQYPIDVTRA
jgi:hypothetical protein